MAIAVFYISFIVLVALITTKYFGVSIFQHKAMSHIVGDDGEHIHTIIGTSKRIGAKIRFENLHKLIIRIVKFTKEEVVYLKRRFDSKQPKFFLKQQKPNTDNKYSVSFFLKNISEHKNSLKGK
jgi:hypothetical protein